MRALVAQGWLFGAAVVLAGACAQTADGPAVPPVVPADSGGDVSIDLRPDGGEVDLDAGAPDGAAPGDGSSVDAAGDAPRGDASGDAAGDAFAGDAGDAGDAGRDAAPDAGCPTGTVAMVTGNAQMAVGLAWTNGSWSSTTSLGGSLAARPALALGSAGFGAVARQAGDGLAAAAYAAGTWSTLAAVPAGDAGALEVLDEPRLVAAGGVLHVVAQKKSDNIYQHAAWAAAAPDSPAPIGSAGDVSFGPRAMSATSAAGDLLIAQAGDNGGVYARTRTGGAFAASVQVLAAGTADKTRPTALAELADGTVLLVHSQVEGQLSLLRWATRSGAAWTAGGKVYDDGTNKAYSAHPLALAALPTGARAVLVLRGDDGKPYETRFDASATPPWSAPVALAGQTAVLASSPSIAPGTCGADLVVAYVEGAAMAGNVKVTRLVGGSWTTPELVPGTGGATYVGIATRP